MTNADEEGGTKEPFDDNASPVTESDAKAVAEETREEDEFSEEDEEEKSNI